MLGRVHGIWISLAVACWSGCGAPTELAPVRSDAGTATDAWTGALDASLPDEDAGAQAPDAGAPLDSGVEVARADGGPLQLAYRAERYELSGRLVANGLDSLCPSSGSLSFVSTTTPAHNALADIECVAGVATFRVSLPPDTYRVGTGKRVETPFELGVELEGALVVTADRTQMKYDVGRVQVSGSVSMNGAPVHECIPTHFIDVVWMAT